MARRSQCSSAGDNPLDPNYLPPHYREEYRLAIDALIENDLEGYYKFLQKANVVDFLSTPEIQYIQSFTHIPHQSYHPEQQLQETGGDGSSDTYWPLQSDQDVPGLDLGWPQLHCFVGPTEVTTLVNPPEPDMPSIKEQARRLIKNAQQVIAIVMDMFTDVDIFADVLDAAMRSVAVYILLDEQNTDYFLNMVSNCRVNLQSIQFLRVRTVSGITYHCRSGKSFKGQMMDRFLLTDCRAVLSGNYSFMWSFEKLHRCMAHLFLGQLVSTFDEEFRILFAQSQPLMFENTLPPMEDFGPLQKRQYPSERTSLYREPRKFLPPDSEERMRHSCDERMDVDWRMMHLKRQEPQQSPADLYSRFPSQQPHMDSSYDQGPFRMSVLENPAFKRHSYAEGVQGRYSYPHLQPQGMPEPEIQGRLFHRGQKPFHGPVQGPEADYSGYDKFWSQDYLSDQYSESGLPQDIQPSDNFDPVLNYLSSTRNVDFDQSSEKLVPEPDLLFSSSYPRGLGIGSYACQTSPTLSNTTEQKLFFQESNTDRKDPTVKQGLRNWRISSYLSTYDNPGDEGLPLAPTQAPEPFEEPSNPLQQTAPGIDFSFPKIPNVREFKVPAIPRASQMPCYTKNTVREKPKKLPDELSAVAPEVKTTPTPTPSESSSTAEGEKIEEAEQKEPKESKTTTLLREESFRRKFSAAPRGSRLRSSLIFSSLDQQYASQDTKTAQGQQDEENDKNDAEQTKLPFVSHVLGQRRSTAREPFEWSRYIKSSTFDNSTTETSKPNDGNSKAANGEQSKVKNSKDLSNSSTVDQVEESLKRSDVEQANSSASIQPSKPSESKQPRTDQPAQAPISLLTTPSYVDMSDPGKRLMFFKELAAQRKAAEAAEAQKSKDKGQVKLRDMKTSTTLKNEEPDTKRTLEKMANTSQSDGLSEKHVTSCKEEETILSAVSEKKELETSHPTNSFPISAKTELPSHEVLKDLELSKLAVKESSLTHLPTHGSEISKQHGLVKNDVSITKRCKELLTKMSTDSEKELETNQPTSLSVAAETEPLQPEPLKDLMLSKSAVNESSLSHPRISTNATPANIPSPEKGSNESQIPNQDSLVKNDSEKKLETNQPTSLSVAAETEPPQPEPQDLMLSKPAVKGISLTHPLPLTNAIPANVPSPEQSSNKSDIPKLDSLVLKDTSTSQSCKEQHTKMSTDSGELEIGKSTKSLPISTETEHPQYETFKDLKLSPAVKESSLSHSPPSTNATSDNVPPPEKGPNGSQIPERFGLDKNDVSTSQSCKEEQTKISTDPEKEPETSQTTTSLPVVAETESSQTEPLKDLMLSKPAVKESSLSHSPPSTNATSANVPSPDQGSNESQIPNQDSLVKNDSENKLEISQPTTSFLISAEREPHPQETLKDLKLSKPVVIDKCISPTSITPGKVTSPEQGPNESEILNCDSILKGSSSLILTSPEEELSAESAPLDSNNQKAESAEFQPVITEPALPPEELSGSEWTYSNTSIQSSTANLIPTHPGSQIIPSLPNSCSVPHSSPENTLLSNVTTEDSSSTLASSILSPSSDKIEALELVSCSPHESSQTAGETCNELTVAESTQVCLQSFSQLTSSEIPPLVDSAKVVSDIAPDTCRTLTKPNTISLQSITKTNTNESCALTLSENKVLESGNNVAPKVVLKESEVLRSSEDVKSDIKPQDLKPTSPKSNFPNVSDLELSTSRPDQIETSNIHLPYKHFPSETSYPANLDITANASQSTVNASKQATLPSEFNLTRIVSPAPVETVFCSYPLTESDGSHFSPEAKKEEINMSTSCIPSDTPSLPKQITADLNQTPSLPLTETSSPNEPTSEVPTEPDPTPEYVTSESHAPEPSDPAEKSEKDQLSKTRKNPKLSDSDDKKPEETNDKINVTTQESVRSEKTNVEVMANNCSDKAAIVSNQVMSPSSQSKQPKASQSRYQSSTANVLSSSNLRDDTKLLLEQISANSQSRNEATKASPVTDDEKEDKAEKTEKIGTFGRRQPKPSEREKLLERIQSMRKERKVYSRFEMAP